MDTSSTPQHSLTDLPAAIRQMVAGTVLTAPPWELHETADDPLQALAVALVPIRIVNREGETDTAGVWDLAVACGLTVPEMMRTLADRAASGHCRWDANTATLHLYDESTEGN